MARTAIQSLKSAGIVVWPLLAGAACTLLLGRILAAFVREEPRLAIFTLIAVLALGGTALWLVVRHQQQRRRHWLAVNARLTRVDEMTGRQFEDLIATLMRADGYREVKIIGRGGDQGADITGRASDGAPVAVQCQRHARPIGAAAVRDFISALRGTYTGRHGIFVTSTTFTEGATEEAQEAGITLIDRDHLGTWLAKFR